MARLRRSDLRAPGITRQRRGTGFAYLLPGGRRAGPEERARCRALVIPPAWREVWICPHPNGHIQAVGVDDAGRRQYIYHEAWTESRSAAKHARVAELARRLPEARRRLARDLAARGNRRERVIALALTLLDEGLFRTGGEQYARDNESYGISTLLRSHVRVSGGTAHFTFPAKSSQLREVSVEHAPVVAAVSALKRAPGGRQDRLLRYRDPDGWHDVTGRDLNEAFRDLVGDDYSVKDLRTWAATVIAALTLAAYPDPPPTERERARRVREACAAVAEQLGNTPAVARRSYIDPAVLDAHERGRTIRPSLRRTLGARDRARLARGEVEGIGNQVAVERAVLRLLDRTRR